MFSTSINWMFFKISSVYSRKDILSWLKLTRLRRVNSIRLILTHSSWVKKLFTSQPWTKWLCHIGTFFKLYSFPLQVRHYYFYSVFLKIPTTKNFSYCLESDNKLPIRNEGGGHSPIAFCCAPTRTKSQNRREYYLQCKLSGVSVCILLLHKCY